MGATGTRISDVSYDASTRHYSAAVTFFGPEGICQMRVTTPGQPGWGYERTLEALTLAGRTALHGEAGTTA